MKKDAALKNTLVMPILCTINQTVSYGTGENILTGDLELVMLELVVGLVALVIGEQAVTSSGVTVTVSERFETSSVFGEVGQFVEQ